MTRKTCSNQSHVDVLLKSVCREYLHSKLNRSRYNTRSVIYPTISDTVLDLCYSYNADAFLQSFKKINGIEIECENIKSLIEDIINNSMARNKMPRTRTHSMTYKVKQSPASPPDYSHRLRTRRHTTFANHFVDTSGDDDSNHVVSIKPSRELRSSSRISLQQLKTAENDTWESGRPKRSCIKHKRISADERLVVDNKNYYKVELMTNKLRSSGTNRDRESDISHVKKIKTSHLVSEDSEDDIRVTKYTPSKRISQLTLLNNEAENFLFPRKDESSSEEDTDADTIASSPALNNRKDSSVLSNNSSIKHNNKNSSKKNEPEEESSMDSTSSEISSVTRKKRRLTQAEAFILDNQRYYKFETPGSRLRYQGSYLSPIALKNNGDYSTNKHHSAKDLKEQKEVVKSRLVLDEIKFSFELVPHTESWYKTFQRQDKGEESYLCYNYTNSGFYNKPFLLPYEMGPLPPLDPNLCLYTYKEMKRHYLGDNNTASTSAACSTPDSSSADASLKNDSISSTGEDTKSSEDSTLMPSDISETFFPKRRRKKYVRKNFFLLTKNPRKSPRQHASTLAILSSFIHQRKRRETHKARHSDPNMSKQNLSTIEEEKRQPEPEPDYEEIAKNIDSLLTDSMQQMDSFVVPNVDGVNVHCKPDAIEALEDFVKCRGIQRNPSILLAKSNGEGAVPGRKPGRKKKKNRTGWPNKNRRPVFRKEGSDSRDGLASSEHENSPSVNADSEENEEPGKDNNRSKNRKNSSLSKLSSYIEHTISQSVSDKTENHNNSTNSDKINGDVQPNSKLNGVNNDNFELNFRNTGAPKRKEHRESSSDNCAEVVIASVGDKIDCVNVDLDMWENAERVLAAKIRSEAINNDYQFQPFVRVQKLDTDILKYAAKQIQKSPAPRRTRPRRMPASPKSPRMLRRPRGGWY